MTILGFSRTKNERTHQYAHLGDRQVERRILQEWKPLARSSDAQIEPLLLD
jgi:hypothetical protein